jgi:transcriptional regulator of heat shock response
MLTDRQIQLLDYIIQEYMESSKPVGSTFLVQKYNLGCSAATVRNEMADLINQGFLEMMHTSSGRVPTSMAYRYFLQELLEEEEIPVLQEVAIKQQVWPARYEIYKLLRELVSVVSDFTKELTIATTDDGFVTHVGSVNMLDDREFWDIEVAKSALQLLDSYELLSDVLKKPVYDGSREVYCLMGDDLPGDNLSQCSIATTRYETPKKSGYLAILGPARMNYERIIPSLRYAKNLVQELVS